MNKKIGILLAVICAIAYGAYPAFSRSVYLGGGNAAFLIMATTFARALGLVLFCFFSRKPIFQTRVDIKEACVGGFFQAITIIGVFAALKYMPGPIVTIIVFTHTLMLLFFLAWRGEIKLNLLMIATTVAALTGLCMVLTIWHPRELSVIGIGLAFVSAVAITGRSYVYGKLTKTRNPAVVGAEAFLVAALIVLFLPLFSEPHLPSSIMGYVWASLCCLAFVVGTFGTFYGIAILGSFEFSLLCKLEPVFTALFSATLVREILSWPQYVGMLVVLVSLAAYQYGTVRLQRGIAAARAA
jgi:drug/metabolite transporter (DMT)-like permease